MWDGRRNPDAPPPLIACRSSEEHARKRVPWAHAFSSASVKDLQPAIIKRAAQLADELEKRVIGGGNGRKGKAEEVNLVDYMSYFA